MNAVVLGSGTTAAFGDLKLKADVRSPVTARRHGVIFVSLTPNRFSRNWISDVWSNTSEFTHPPLLHGEITIIGTRAPNPYGPLGYSELPGKISSVIGTVDRPCSCVWGGVGGTTWSKKPSFSSYIRKNAVLLHTSGFAVSA